MSNDENCSPLTSDLPEFCVDSIWRHVGVGASEVGAMGSFPQTQAAQVPRILSTATTKLMDAGLLERRITTMIEV